MKQTMFYEERPLLQHGATIHEGRDGVREHADRTQTGRVSGSLASSL